MAYLKLSTNTVKKSISAHRSIALAIAALLYLTCLTGTLSVFFEEFQRWEQPNIEESTDYTPTQIQTAIQGFQQRVSQMPETLWVVLPTEAVPRMHISGDGQEWFINRDGHLSVPPQEPWTTMLTKLHVQLHLPQNIGLILVGILGVLLFGLIFSGLLSHPNIFKDAFRWRRGRQALTQVDLHNRLSIWALPFYLMISFTGAFIGLIGLFSFIAGAAFYDNDNEALLDDIYGGDPEISIASVNLDIDKAFNTLESMAPEAKPIYLAIQNLGTDKQYFEIAATLPQRLIYSEIYRFHGDGSLINHQQFSDGAVGRQIAYSVYRLHFGHYAGQWVKVIYGLLGLALSVICVSGINIWLAQRKHESALNDLWVAIVWGLPLALAFSALLSFYHWEPLWVFLSTEFIAVIFALLMKQAHKTRWILMACLTVTLLIIVFMREVLNLNESVPSIFHLVNLIVLVVSLILGTMLFLKRKHCRT
ncbi:MAG: PepSY-associated TM helix domain-containing protein [Pseudomonadales bacterium]|nr:PepSY-associated TM helix domain-containing protein [Pseudomonadales bacterium]